MKVARKLTLALICAIILVLLASSVLRVQREHALFETDIVRDTQILGRTLGHAVEQTWRERGKAEALELIEYASRQESHLLIRWVWPSPRADTEHRPVAPADSLKPLYDGEPVVLSVAAHDAMYTYMPVRVPESRLGAIEIAESLGAEHEYLKRSILHASITALALVLLSGLLTWALGITIIGRPMKRLVEHAQAIGRGEYGRRLSIPRRDEIGELAREMDAMSRSLKEAHDQLQQESASRIAAVEQLQHADRLATVGTLASGIAHELGTPINVVEGHAQLIREDPEASEGVKDNATVIGRQCKRMAQIIRQLLDFARGGPRGGSSDVGPLTEETIGMLQPYMRKRQVEAVLTAGAGDHRVAVNYHQLQQVLTNFVMNAIDAMPHGGTLDISVGRDHGRSPDREGEFVTLAVKDSGVGMSRETLARIFEPFFTTKDVGDGTGLGLSVAYGIVESHGGWIEVQSELGRGTTFTVYLPPGDGS